MTHTSKSITNTPRWARMLVLLGAVGLMPVGLASAGELASKQVDRAEPRERAEQTPQRERAERRETDRRPDRVTDRATEREADHAPEGIEGHYRRLGVDAELIVAYLAKEGVGRIQMEATLGATLRLTHAIKEQGGAFELNDDMAGYLQREIGLDREQIGTVVELAKKLAEQHAERERDAEHGEKDEVDIRGYFLRLGLDEEAITRVEHTLREHGLGQVQIDPALGGLFHTVLGIQEHGLEATVGDEKFQAYFAQQVGLDEEQIELVTRLAQRIARATQRDERGGERGERGERESDRREREGERETDRRERDVAPERRERQDRERAERRERRDREAERDRDERDEARQGEDKVDLAAYAGRVRSAFASGEMDADEARRHMDGLRERMVHEVELALEAEKITRDEAREKVAAIHEMTQLPEREGDAP